MIATFDDWIVQQFVILIILHSINILFMCMY